ncbi:MAG: tRNA preQ1(34) S-adenosylmethionine ribosyltransferase-isomerase QueA [Coriobacteriales bacterium]|nr:tRNA preQ1(34) S-adenosylmethionine ribosyltransferase-isomerase QueA [Coriobacteriales bacterium]
MRTDEFDYDLPTGSIAQHPAEPRDSCRLLVLDRASGQIDHRIFSDLPEYLRPGDLLVVNETRVLPARLAGRKAGSGGSVEVLLLREAGENTWECLVKPGRRVRAGARLEFGEGELTGYVLDVDMATGSRLVLFKPQGESFRTALHRLGEVPLPPYISEPLDDPEEYQTIFATEERSAAAPTAGLHFTPELLDRVAEAGTQVAAIELDIGLDTFRPVSEEDPELHHIHTEHFRVPEATAEAIARSRERNGRIIAVGTTAVRALESAYDGEAEEVVACEGATSLYILPGYRFRAVDALVTNFHVPRSTLLMLVSAFAGRETVLGGYDDALELGYRFLSFGDAMLIL